MILRSVATLAIVEPRFGSKEKTVPSTTGAAMWKADVGRSASVQRNTPSSMGIIASKSRRLHSDSSGTPASSTVLGITSKTSGSQSGSVGMISPLAMATTVSRSNGTQSTSISKPLSTTAATDSESDELQSIPFMQVTSPTGDKSEVGKVLYHLKPEANSENYHRTLNQLSSHIHQLQGDVAAIKDALMSIQAPIRRNFSPEINLLTENLSVVSGRVGEIQTVKFEMQMMQQRLKRIEDGQRGPDSSPPANSVAMYVRALPSSTLVRDTTSGTPTPNIGTAHTRPPSIPQEAGKARTANREAPNMTLLDDLKSAYAVPIAPSITIKSDEDLFVQFSDAQSPPAFTTNPVIAIETHPKPQAQVTATPGKGRHPRISSSVRHTPPWEKPDWPGAPETYENQGRKRRKTTHFDEKPYSNHNRTSGQASNTLEPHSNSTPASIPRSRDNYRQVTLEPEGGRNRKKGNLHKTFRGYHLRVPQAGKSMGGAMG